MQAESYWHQKLQPAPRQLYIVLNRHAVKVYDLVARYQFEHLIHLHGAVIQQIVEVALLLVQFHLASAQVVSLFLGPPLLEAQHLALQSEWQFHLKILRVVRDWYFGMSKMPDVRLLLQDPPHSNWLD